jgi:hypothetical protein
MPEKRGTDSCGEPVEELVDASPLARINRVEVAAAFAKR